VSVLAGMKHSARSPCRSKDERKPIVLVISDQKIPVEKNGFAKVS